MFAFGCASAEKRAFEKDLAGRWTGGPVDPPAGVWFAKAAFDIAFSETGDFSAVAATFAKHRYDLHFQGAYKVKSRGDGGFVVLVEQPDLGGEWAVVRTAAGELTISRGDMTLALRKRYGS